MTARRSGIVNKVQRILKSSSLFVNWTAWLDRKHSFDNTLDQFWSDYDNHWSENSISEKVCKIFCRFQNCYYCTYAVSNSILPKFGDFKKSHLASKKAGKGGPGRDRERDGRLITKGKVRLVLFVYYSDGIFSPAIMLTYFPSDRSSSDVPKIFSWCMVKPDWEDPGS